MTLLEQNDAWQSLDGVPDADRTDAVTAALSGAFGPVRLTRRVAPAYQAQIRRRDLAGMRLIECVCDPCAGRRKADDDEPFVGVQIVLAGRERFRVGDEQLAVGPGDLLVWSNRQPNDFEVTERLHKATVTIPWAWLADRLPRGAVLRGCSLDTQGGLGSVLFSHIRALVGEAQHLESADAPAVRRATLELLAAAAAHRLELVVPDYGREHVRRVQAYVLDHLADHDLSPARIAAANGISLRYLHHLFHQTGQGVAAWVQQQRLERCREALADDLFAGRTITEIASRFGFGDSSHFSRAFKRQFGDSPARYRLTAAGPGPR